MFLTYQNKFLFGILVTLLIAFGKLTFNMYHQVYVKTKHKHTQVDHHIVESHAEIIAQRQLRDFGQQSTLLPVIIESVQKSVSTQTELVPVYDIPRTRKSVSTQTGEPVPLPSLTQKNVKDHNDYLKCDSYKRWKSAPSIDSGVTRTSLTEESIISDSESEQDPLEKIGPNTSEFIEDSNTKISLTDTPLSIVDLYQSTPF
ncbi:MAG: hypothetical protein U0X86_000886 [Wolbachia endosymbiont of Xenopsylla cheopis]